MGYFVPVLLAILNSDVKTIFLIDKGKSPLHEYHTLVLKSLIYCDFVQKGERKHVLFGCYI